MWTRVQLDSLQLLQAEWVRQESATSYPPKVLKYIIVAKNRVMQVYNKEVIDGYMDREGSQIHGTRAMEAFYLVLWMK